MERLSHFDAKGNAIMVDVSEKMSTSRIATAKGKIVVNKEVYKAIAEGTVKKGDVLGVARVAGIMAAKQASSLIPMCHPLLITKCSVDFVLLPDESAVEASATVKVNGQTGVEMEALTAVSTALLTIYDMCKALDKTMEIRTIALLEKSGGKSGNFVNTNVL
ncbi:MAG: cyclic pyranopterin monophosphate synthase accessory protein [Massilibacillus sp.]|jgi:cyclic pyranopterin phosphate synthase|nr:cyclic pyranopterin monophosphate synthase accessory protein [Massilibacillus sp.]